MIPATKGYNYSYIPAPDNTAPPDSLPCVLPFLYNNLLLPHEPTISYHFTMRFPYVLHIIPSLPALAVKIPPRNSTRISLFQFLHTVDFIILYHFTKPSKFNDNTRTLELQATFFAICLIAVCISPFPIKIPDLHSAVLLFNIFI